VPVSVYEEVVLQGENHPGAELVSSSVRLNPRLLEWFVAQLNGE